MKKLSFIGLALLASIIPISANAQKYGATPEDSVQCVQNIALYSEFYKQKDYVNAYEPWKEVLKTCPRSSENVFIRGTTIVKTMIAQKDITPARRDSLMEELFGLYDLRIQYFGKEGPNKARKAADIEAYKGKKAVETYYPIYAEGITIGQESVPSNLILKFFEATINYVNITKKADVDLIVENYNIASTLLEKQLAATPGDAEKINPCIANVEALFAPYATCEKLEEIFTKKFEAAPEDTVLLRKICDLLESKKCMESKLYFDATEQLHKLAPSPQTAYLMGNLCYAKKQFSEAAKYFQEAANGLSEDKDKYKAYIRLAAAYQGAHSYAASRSAAYSAAKLDPNSGEPYLIIASLYAQSAGSCCGDSPVQRRAAFWAAVDKAVRARSIDNSPEIQERANKFIGTYSAHFPKKADAFMENVIDGQSYYVGGWIGESTTVRTRN